MQRAWPAAHQQLCPEGTGCPGGWLLGLGVTWEDLGLWPHKVLVSGPGAHCRSRGEHIPSVNHPSQRPGVTFALCPCL